ncbi:hypothetical protein GCM10017635_11480 [Paracoccus kondratievae]|uniref:Stability/partitioning determinant n=1 Tax=Paracoccus kondratievae TaxID=135740 RepID=A0AAD3RTA9_9RHOB|nr:hypothetical protein GCM10017635_11480 [Paracoccus kondratievae]
MERLCARDERISAHASPPFAPTITQLGNAFKSREPQAVESGAGQGDAPRRRRTGRSAQFNLKAKPITIEAFCAVADRQGWGLGETLEKAVELLEREYGR